MTRGQLIGIGAGFGLAVGLLAGWVIGSTVAVNSLAALLKEERAHSEEAEQAAEKLRLQEGPRQLAGEQFARLQSCAAIRVDVKKENDEEAYYLSGKKVSRDDLHRALAEAVTWDGKPDLLVVMFEPTLIDAAAAVEEAAKESHKFSLPGHLVVKEKAQ
jgi:hypothetical protein